MSDIDDTLNLVAPGLITTLAGVLVGYWLSTASMDRAARRNHRKQLRAIRSNLSECPWEVFDSIAATKEWWVTAVEDYGFIRRWLISRVVHDISSLDYPEFEGDRNDESSQTPEINSRNNKKEFAFIRHVESLVDKALRWA
jgi:hypothetical protein